VLSPCESAKKRELPGKSRKQGSFWDTPKGRRGEKKPFRTILGGDGRLDGKERKFQKLKSASPSPVW